MSEERLKKLRTNLQISKEIASQFQNLQPKHLESIKKLWEGQEQLMFSDDAGAQPTMQELLSDLKVIDQTGSYVGHFIKNLRANVSAFDTSDYAEKLVHSLKEVGEINWDNLTDIALPIVNRAPGVTVLLGTFKPSTEEVGMIEKKKRSLPKKKDQILEKQTAENVKQIDRDSDSVDVKVAFVLAALERCFEQNQNNPIDFYRFVLHPIDFTTTVENIFYISFIIRDGLAILDIIDDEFVISPTKDNKKKQPNNKVEKNQMIFSITMFQWQELVADYQISHPAIEWKNS